jgi:hypothetical protein
LLISKVKKEKNEKKKGKGREGRERFEGQREDFGQGRGILGGVADELRRRR